MLAHITNLRLFRMVRCHSHWHRLPLPPQI